MIRRADKADLAALRGLWSELLPDGEALAGVYAALAAPERTLVLERDGRTEGVVLCSIEPLRIPGAGELAAAYIFGAAARDEGGLRELVTASLAAARDRGTAAATVRPRGDEEFAFYRSLGFAEMFSIEYSAERRAAIAPSDEKVAELPPERAPECEEIFTQVARWRSHQARSRDMWRAAAEAEYARGGAMLAVLREGEIIGYALCREDGGAAVIDELFCEDEPEFNALRLAVMDRFATDTATLCAPACPHGARRFGMIRALDPKTVVEAGLKRRPGDFEIEVEDTELPELSGRVSVRDGVAAVGERTGTVSITPGDLAALTLGGGPAPFLNPIV